MMYSIRSAAVQIILATSLIAGAVKTHADTLPAGSCSIYGPLGSPSLPPGANATCGPNYVSANAIYAAGQPSNGAGGSATEMYYFEIEGAANIQLTTDVSYLTSLAADTNNNGVATGQLTINNSALVAAGAYPPLQVITSYQATDGFTGYYTINEINHPISNGVITTTSVLLQTNTLYYVFMEATAGANDIYNNAGGSASSYVDPLIAIDPSAPAGYSVVLSPGYANAVTPVPIPGGGLLMLSGLGVFVLHRRRLSV